MEVFKGRPLMLCCVVFVATAGAAFCFNGTVKLIAAAVLSTLAAALTVAVIAVRERLRKLRIAVALTAVLLSIVAVFSSYTYFDLFVSESGRFAGEEPVTLTAEVLGIESMSEESTTCYIHVSEIDGEKVSFKAALWCGFQAGLRRGERVALRAKGVPLGDQRGFLSANQLISDGISAEFIMEEDIAEDILMLTPAGHSLSYYLGEISYAIGTRLSDGIGGEAGKIAAALLIGDRGGLSDTSVRDFSRSGISHLLALSGLHVAIIAGFFELFGRLLFIPKNIRSVLTVPLLIAYLFLTGFRLPTVRAALMLSAVCVSYLFRRKLDGATVLSVIATAILLILPSSAADVGFWMSFISAFAIIVTAPHTARLFSGIKGKSIGRIVTYIAGSALVTLTANVAILFIVSVDFGEVSLLAVPANIVTAPAVTLLIVISLLYLMLGWIPFFGRLAAMAARLIGDCILGVAGRISAIPNVSLSLEYRFADIIIILMSVALAVLFVVRLRRKLFAALPVAVAAIAFSICLAVTLAMGKGNPDVIYISHNQSDMLVMVENGKAVICDLSDGAYVNFGNALDLLRGECATEVDTLILTQYRDRHKVSVKKLVTRKRVRKLLLPEPESGAELIIMTEMIDVARANGTECVIYACGDEIEIFDGSTLSIDYGHRLDRSQISSALVKFSAPGGELVYIGASYAEAAGTDLSGMVADRVVFGVRGPLPAEPYKLPHGAREVIFSSGELLGFADLGEDELPELMISDCKYRKFSFDGSR